jgi:hypothetical protein
MKVNVDMETNELIDHYFPDSDSKESEVENESESKRWQPKKWKIEYEKIVLMDFMGMKGYEIAEKLNYTPQQVYNILGCDEAIAIQKMMIGKIRNQTFNMADELNEIQKLTVKRLKQCLKSDDDFKTSRLGFIAKGIDVMKGMGEHLKNSPTTQVTNQFTIPPSVADRFLEGLKKSDEAKALLQSGRNLGDVVGTEAS